MSATALAVEHIHHADIAPEEWPYLADLVESGVVPVPRAESGIFPIHPEATRRADNVAWMDRDPLLRAPWHRDITPESSKRMFPQSARILRSLWRKRHPKPCPHCLRLDADEKARLSRLDGAAQKSWPMTSSGNRHMVRPLNVPPCRGCSVCKGHQTDDGARETRAKYGDVTIRRRRPEPDQTRATVALIEQSKHVLPCYRDSRTDRWEWVAQSWCELEEPSERVAADEESLDLDARIAKAIDRAQDWLFRQRFIVSRDDENSLPPELHESEDSNSAALAFSGDGKVTNE